MLLRLLIIEFDLRLHLVILPLRLGHVLVKVGFEVVHYLLIHSLFLSSLWHHCRIPGWSISLLWTLENVWLRTFLRDLIDAIAVLSLAVAREWTCLWRYCAWLFELLDLLLLLGVHLFELLDFALEIQIICWRRWIDSASAVVCSIRGVMVLFILKVLLTILESSIERNSIILLIFILVLVGISEIDICYSLIGFDILLCSSSQSVVVLIIETISDCNEQVRVVLSSTCRWMICLLLFQE